MSKKTGSRSNVIEQRYVPTTWENGDIITAEKLNNMEAGIAAAATAAEAAAPFIVSFSGTTCDGNAACDKTHAEVKAAYDSGKQITARYVAGTSIYQLNTSIELNGENEYEYLWGDYSIVASTGTAIYIECRINSREVTASSETFDVRLPVPNPDNPVNDTK